MRGMLFVRLHLAIIKFTKLGGPLETTFSRSMVLFPMELPSIYMHSTTAACWKKYVTAFEENCLRNPRPDPKDEPMFVTLLKYAMPMLGYHAWDTLCNEDGFEKLSLLISQCPTGSHVVSWITNVQKEIDGGKHNGKDPPEFEKFNQAASMMRTVFSSTLPIDDATEIRLALLLYRQKICDDAIDWLRSKKASLVWEQKHGWVLYEKRAVTDYKAWKVGAKPKSNANTFPNLVKAYKEYRGCNDAEAQIQAAKDSVWIDTSDEDSPTPVKNMGEVRDKSNLRKKGKVRKGRVLGESTDAVVENEEQPVVFDECAPEWAIPPGPAVQQFLHRLDEQEHEREEYRVRKEQQETNWEKGLSTDKDDTPTVSEEEVLQDKLEQDLNEIVPDSMEEVSFDDFTTTQVLFGHGSFGGITLSQADEAPNKVMNEVVDEPFGCGGGDASVKLASTHLDNMPAPTNVIQDQLATEEPIDKHPTPIDIQKVPGGEEPIQNQPAPEDDIQNLSGGEDDSQKLPGDEDDI